MTGSYPLRPQGFGYGLTGVSSFQVLPFQDSARAKPLLLMPTATQLVALEQDTSFSRLISPTRSEACQDMPFQTWEAKLTTPESMSSISSVRTQLVVLPQDRPDTENSGTSTFCWCQLVPSQDIVSLPVFSMQNVVDGQEIVSAPWPASGLGVSKLTDQDDPSHFSASRP